MARSTPWGSAQDVTTFERGLSFVSTSSHGGIMVSKSNAEKTLTKAALKRGLMYSGYYCYEEDSDCAIVIWERPDLFEEPHREDRKGELLRSLSMHHPDYLIETGVEPSKKEYDEWLRTQRNRRMRDEKSPELIVFREYLPFTREYLKIMTADGLSHFVKKEDDVDGDILNLDAVLFEDELPTVCERFYRYLSENGKSMTADTLKRNIREYATQASITEGLSKESLKERIVYMLDAFKLQLVSKYEVDKIL